MHEFPSVITKGDLVCFLFFIFSFPSVVLFRFLSAQTEPQKTIENTPPRVRRGNTAPQHRTVQGLIDACPTYSSRNPKFNWTRRWMSLHVCRPYIPQTASRRAPTAAPASSAPPCRSTPCRHPPAWEPAGNRCARSPCRPARSWCWLSGCLRPASATWWWLPVCRPPPRTGPPPPTWSRPGPSLRWPSS